ncbi:neural cell adhesion molecule 1-like isoform X2 [Acipenser ruthenus]|nr:neural cell adhesion molecule 1-like isoform X2 [Acipenser ruthenus]
MTSVSMFIWAMWLVAAADAKKEVEIIPASGDTQLHSIKLFLCKVKGGEADMKWLDPNGTEIEDGEDQRFTVEKIDETTSTLLINRAEKNDNGIYTCVSTFEDGTAERVTVNIKVVPPPTARISEDSVNATAGSTSSITCVVEGDPQPHINWTRNGRPIKAKPGRFGFNSDQSVLTIYAVEKTDEGQYTCIATNKINSSSANVTLHVSVKPEVQLERSKEARPQESTSITCNATGDPLPTMHWVRKGNKLVPDSRTEISQQPLSSTLTLQKVEPSDGGIYTCVATSPVGEDRQDVLVQTIPFTPDNVRANPGAASVDIIMEMPKPIEGAEILRYKLQWREEGRSQWSTTTVEANNSLTIAGLLSDTSYEVRVAAINKIGEGGFSAQNKVRTLASMKPEVQLERSKEARPQESTSITCNATGDPLPTMHWVRKGNKLVPDSRTEISQQPLSSTLTLQKVEPSDGGIYTCVATSPVGEDRQDVIVQTIPFTPDNVRANPGAASVDIIMEMPKPIEGAEILRYKLQWREEGRSQWSTTTVEANNSLTIAGLLSDTSYEVRVAAINKIGEGGFSAQNKVRTLASIALSVSEKPGVGTGGIVGIVMVIFLVLLVAVDTTCYFTNHCGLMMCIAVNLLGKRPPGAKGLDEEERNVSTVDVGLKGLSASQGGAPNQPNGVLSEVTCDKAPLTGFE